MMDGDGGAPAVIHGVPVSWDRVRELFTLDPAVAYLHSGAFGVVPTPVQRAQQRLREESESNPASFIARGLTDRLGHVRRHIAGFLGADPDGTALVTNTTTGIAIVLGSLQFTPGDEIVYTDHGYGAVTLALQRLCSRTGAVAREVHVPLAATDSDVVAHIVAAIKPGRTKLVIVDHVTSPTAKQFPVGRIAAALRELDVALLVDAAHAPGMLPVDVAAIGADYWVGNLHKWAFAPRPSAVLVVAPQHRAQIEPLVVSWQQRSGYPLAVEFAGTLDYTNWLAAPTGLHLLRTLGEQRVRQHNIHLANYGQDALAVALGVNPADLVRSPAVPMRVVPVPPDIAVGEEGAIALCDQLSSQYKIEVGVKSWRGSVLLRICAQLHNTEAHLDRLADALSEIAALRRRRAA